MAKLKTFEEYISDLDSTEEIEKGMMDAGEPEELGKGEEVISTDQPEAEAPKSSDDEGAGVEAEEIEADTKEVNSEEDKETEEGDQKAPKDEGEEGAKEVTESKEVEEDEIETQIADDEESDDDDDEESDDDDEESDEAKVEITVEELVKELYERVKAEAMTWEKDLHDTHTIESYLKENAALVAMMAAKTLKESRKDITQEAYEAACNDLKEAYAKKIDEMMEVMGSEGEKA